MESTGASWDGTNTVTSSNTELVPLQLRASSMHRICTNKPKFDQAEYDRKEQDLLAVLDKKGLVYESDQIDTYCKTQGIMTKAKAFKTQQELKVLAEEDPLPTGAKTYLQELWLENHYEFYEVSTPSDDPKFLKGHAVENGAISVVGQLYKLEIEKNTQRITKGIITGECDVKYDRVIRDTKCPEDWKSFRKKTSLEIAYYWQLVTYCYLYDCDEAYVDYVLMKTPQDIFDMMVRYHPPKDVLKLQRSNDSIESLPLNQRVKTFKAEGIKQNIEFLINRAAKAEAYYNSLTYEQCMNMVV